MVAFNGPLWVWGPFGSGVSTLSEWLAGERGSQAIERSSVPDMAQWLESNPRGIVASEKPCPETATSAHGFLELRLWSIDEDPSALPSCLDYLAKEEGIGATYPPALASLPCNGNLRELRNRIIRWRLIGQVSEESLEKGRAELLEAEDIASNLHILERTLLHRALRRSYGNRAEAAKRLGVSRRQLYLLIQRHGDPVRGETAVAPVPKRLAKKRRDAI